MLVEFKSNISVKIPFECLEITEEIITKNDLKTIENLMDYLSKYIKGQELFNDGDLLPGNLCVVNDVDWMLTGEKETNITHRDVITFIPTIHGG